MPYYFSVVNDIASWITVAVFVLIFWYLVKAVRELRTLRILVTAFVEHQMGDRLAEERLGKAVESARNMN